MTQKERGVRGGTVLTDKAVNGEKSINFEAQIYKPVNYEEE